MKTFVRNVAENKKEDGQVFRGGTLTESGERRLTLLGMRLRGSDVTSPATQTRNAKKRSLVKS
jgi:hypothetical protein